jgi:hypothetical protein
MLARSYKRAISVALSLPCYSFTKINGSFVSLTAVIKKKSIFLQRGLRASGDLHAVAHAPYSHLRRQFVSEQLVEEQRDAEYRRTHVHPHDRNAALLVPTALSATRSSPTHNTAAAAAAAAAAASSSSTGGGVGAGLTANDAMVYVRRRRVQFQNGELDRLKNNGKTAADNNDGDDDDGDDDGDDEARGGVRARAPRMPHKSSSFAQLPPRPIGRTTALSELHTGRHADLFDGHSSSTADVASAAAAAALVAASTAAAQHGFALSMHAHVLDVTNFLCASNCPILAPACRLIMTPHRVDRLFHEGCAGARTLPVKRARFNLLPSLRCVSFVRLCVFLFHEGCAGARTLSVKRARFCVQPSLRFSVIFCCFFFHCARELYRCIHHVCFLYLSVRTHFLAVMFTFYAFVLQHLNALAAAQLVFDSFDSLLATVTAAQRAERRHKQGVLQYLRLPAKQNLLSSTGDGTDNNGNAAVKSANNGHRDTSSSPVFNDATLRDVDALFERTGAGLFHMCLLADLRRLVAGDIDAVKCAEDVLREYNALGNGREAEFIKTSKRGEMRAAGRLDFSHGFTHLPTLATTLRKMHLQRTKLFERCAAFLCDEDNGLFFSKATLTRKQMTRRRAKKRWQLVLRAARTQAQLKLASESAEAKLQRILTSWRAKVRTSQFFHGTSDYTHAHNAADSATPAVGSKKVILEANITLRRIDRTVSPTTPSESPVCVSPTALCLIAAAAGSSVGTPFESHKASTTAASTHALTLPYIGAQSPSRSTSSSSPTPAMAALSNNNAKAATYRQLRERFIARIVTRVHSVVAARSCDAQILYWRITDRTLGHLESLAAQRRRFETVEGLCAELDARWV